MDDDFETFDELHAAASEWLSDLRSDLAHLTSLQAMQDRLQQAAEEWSKEWIVRALELGRDLEDDLCELLKPWLPYGLGGEAPPEVGDPILLAYDKDNVLVCWSCDLERPRIISRQQYEIEAAA